MVIFFLSMSLFNRFIKRKDEEERVQVLFINFVATNHLLLVLVILVILLFYKLWYIFSYNYFELVYGYF